MEESYTPAPEPSGALVPPGNRPPTITATGLLPSPAPRPRPTPTPLPTGWSRLLERARTVADAVLDATDEVVDRVADAIGLRRERRP